MGRALLARRDKLAKRQKTKDAVHMRMRMHGTHLSQIHCTKARVTWTLRRTLDNHRLAIVSNYTLHRGGGVRCEFLLKVQGSCVNYTPLVLHFLRGFLILQFCSSPPRNRNRNFAMIVKNQLHVYTALIDGQGPKAQSKKIRKDLHVSSSIEPG